MRPAQVRATQLVDFYGNISFGPIGMNAMDGLVLQAGAGDVNIVFSRQLATTPLHFPMPSWATRRCRAGGQTSCANGYCNVHGICTCFPGFAGRACDIVSD